MRLCEGRREPVDFRPLARVRLVHPQARVEATTEALVVHPSRTHVLRVPRR